MKITKLPRAISAIALIWTAGAAWQAQARPVSAAIIASVADPGRPAKDTALDAARKPADILSFIRLHPGETIVDVFPGAYWDRLFSKVVGPTGHVDMFLPLEAAKAEHIPVLAEGASPLPNHPNVTAYSGPINNFSIPKPADIIWIRQNYHDLYDPFMGPANVPVFNKAVFNALKPGGYFVVIDHSAPAGSGLADTNTTHRIDGSAVKTDMAAAGFKFVGESNVLRNPADTRLDKVFAPSIRGKTDQFIYLFQKP